MCDGGDGGGYLEIGGKGVEGGRRGVMCLLGWMSGLDVRFYCWKRIECFQRFTCSNLFLE